FLLERQMHALVAAVLLRVAGLDALDIDPEPQPPDREARQTEERVGPAPQSLFSTSTQRASRRSPLLRAPIASPVPTPAVIFRSTSYRSRRRRYIQKLAALNV